MAALANPKHEALDLSADRVATRLRLAKEIAIERKSKGGLAAVNKALAKIGKPYTLAAELAMLTELDAVRTALYRHYDTNNELLYVGVSLSAITRLGQHKREQWWFERIARIDIEWYDTKSEALDAERHAIIHGRPLYNIVHANARQP